jgi:hypothetical protein
VTPERIRARLAELSRLSGGRRVEAVARVLDAWSDPASPWRERLEAELPEATGFTPPVVREGLRLALAGWTGDALRELVELEAPEEAAGVTAVLLAGSIPMPSILALLAPLALGSAVFAKCAARDPVTPPLVARSLRELEPELGARIEVADFRGDDAARVATLCEADLVVASGSDETVARVRGRRVVRHGHRLSVAAVGAGACPAEELALDVALWDQLGCLSPLAVYARDADGLARALAAALEEIGRRLPRGRVDSRSATLAVHERDAAELRGAGVSSGAGWTVVREADSHWRPAPLHRFVRVHPVADAGALLEALAPVATHLAGVALAGFGPDTPRLAGELASLGASRVCAPGRLQAPPLAWPRDGLGVLTGLPRQATIELTC